VDVDLVGDPGLASIGDYVVGSAARSSKGAKLSVVDSQFSASGFRHFQATVTHIQIRACLKKLYWVAQATCCAAGLPARWKGEARSCMDA